MARAPLVVAALLAAAASGSLLEASERAAAAAWLRARAGQPNGDELEELRASNPEAYAIVKTLLVKRQLGVLDTKHPSTGSFEAEAAAAAPISLARQGAQATSAAIVEPTEDASAQKRDWFAWKPSTEDAASASGAPPATAQDQSPEQDQGVLGRLASASKEASDLMADGASLDEIINRPAAATASAGAGQPHSFWGGFTSGLSAALADETRPAAPAHSIAMSQQAASSGQNGNPLLNFDWLSPAEDEAPPARQASRAGNPYLRKAGWTPDAPPAGGENPYLALGDMHPHRVEAAAAHGPAAEPSALSAWLMEPRVNPVPPRRHY